MDSFNEARQVSRPGVSRRSILQAASAAGLGSTLFPGALLGLLSSSSTAEAQQLSPSDLRGWPMITPEMIDAAGVIAAIKISDEQKQTMLNDLVGKRNSWLRIRSLKLPNSVAPVTVTLPIPPRAPQKDPATGIHGLGHVDLSSYTGVLETNGIASEQLAFATVTELGALLRAKRVTPTGLTKMYLARLRRYDPQLHFVITYTEERALKQAAAADARFAAHMPLGPLDGIPWGSKDLLAVAGYPTTWGAGGYEAQHFDTDAVVVQRLAAAGAVLLAKLSLGALAQGDLWGGVDTFQRTRNPWNPQQGSSGSSAGSASSVSAGCVGFAIGTETLGSISSPSTRCGVVGLRPSYGLVPRTGAMALSWSMDKIGPIARSVEDAALVLNVIQGPDGHDLSVQPAGFSADFSLDLRKLRIGYLKSAFDEPVFKPSSEDDLARLTPEERTKRTESEKTYFARRAYDAKFDRATLDKLRAMGLTLTPCELPSFPFGALGTILSAEGAAAFDELTTSGRDALLAGQSPGDWPNSFREARFIPAVDYIQAQRARSLAMQQMHDLFAQFDVIVAPSGGMQLTATNHTGQPAIIVPNGLRGDDAPAFVPPDANDPVPSWGGPGTPVSITFLAPLYAEGPALALANAYAKATGFTNLHPKLK
ncbi:Asp-tRNAAsn/Glu-tRNAGln amidotransferase A subunit [Bryocella elongata]|uniref:Asp-tRNAAsn/Glu-tRNAGln amidotransferase A subunit n=1 Tax=Bryocella elongata TaxID=863522 RepID=A0A1H6A5X2_9BACT|nr:amidase [Bryocella elongata]SEG43427.1 Asp-tRNAAsn/Glu-tRNAGln amidotransferase A subunit [Bryocella elongata]